jgi:hypothetical protein
MAAVLDVLPTPPPSPLMVLVYRNDQLASWLCEPASPITARALVLCVLRGEGLIHSDKRMPTQPEGTFQCPPTLALLPAPPSSTINRPRAASVLGWNFQQAPAGSHMASS